MYGAGSMLKVCVAREFTTMALSKTSPIISWLRALARNLHADVGGPGVGAVGMCFAGGFALGMMVDDIMLAPVLSQPSLPFAIGSARSADLNLSPDDAAAVAERAAQGCQVLGLRFTGDRLVGDRFSSLRELLGDAFIAIELPSSASSRTIRCSPSIATTPASSGSSSSSGRSSSGDSRARRGRAPYPVAMRRQADALRRRFGTVPNPARPVAAVLVAATLVAGATTSVADARRGSGCPVGRGVR